MFSDWYIRVELLEVPLGQDALLLKTLENYHTFEKEGIEDQQLV